MIAERTELGREIETALGEVLAHVRAQTELPCRMVEDPAAGQNGSAQTVIGTAQSCSEHRSLNRAPIAVTHRLTAAGWSGTRL